MVCPGCGSSSPADAFQCPRCLLILNPDSASAEILIDEDGVAEESVVRTLVAPPRHVLIPEPPQRPPRAEDDAEITAPFTVPIEPDTVPTVVADVDLMLKPLHPFEAYVLAFIDGVASVAQLARRAKLEEIEVQVVLSSLLDRKVIELPTAQPQPAAPPPSGPLQEPPSPEGARRPESVLQQAIALERKGNVSAAVQVLERGISRSPAAAQLYNKLALVLAGQRQDFAKAEELLQKAVALEPGNAVYQQNLYKVLGRAAVEEGKGKGKAVLGRVRLVKKR